MSLDWISGGQKILVENFWLIPNWQASSKRSWGLVFITLFGLSIWNLPIDFATFPLNCCNGASIQEAYCPANNLFSSIATWRIVLEKWRIPLVTVNSRLTLFRLWPCLLCAVDIEIKWKLHIWRIKWLY